MLPFSAASQEVRRNPMDTEPTVVALSTKTEGSYPFDVLVQHEAFRGYKKPILATDFVVVPTRGVCKATSQFS